jgi:hypothetical protein
MPPFYWHNTTTTSELISFDVQTTDTENSPTSTLIATQPPHPIPSPSLIELPYAAGNFSPTPNSTNIPLNATISISFGRPPSICNFNITPTVALEERVFKPEGFGGTYVFYLAELLQPQTTYTVTIIYGQETAKEGFKPTTDRTWQFTTETSSTSNLSTSAPIPTRTNFFVFPDLLPLSIGLVIILAIGTLGTIIYLKKRT